MQSKLRRIVTGSVIASFTMAASLFGVAMVPSQGTPGVPSPPSIDPVPDPEPPYEIPVPVPGGGG